MGSKTVYFGLKWAAEKAFLYSILQTLIQATAFCSTTQLYVSWKHELLVWLKLTAEFPLIAVVSSFWLKLVFCKCIGSGSTNNHLIFQMPSVCRTTCAVKRLTSIFSEVKGRSAFHQTLIFSSHHSYVIILFRSRDAKMALTAVQNITFMHFSLVILNIITSDAIKLISFKWINPPPNLELQTSNIRLLEQSFKPLPSVEWDKM